MAFCHVLTAINSFTSSRGKSIIGRILIDFNADCASKKVADVSTDNATARVEYNIDDTPKNNVEKKTKMYFLKTINETGSHGPFEMCIVCNKQVS